MTPVTPRRFPKADIEALRRPISAFRSFAALRWSGPMAERSDFHVFVRSDKLGLPLKSSALGVHRKENLHGPRIELAC